ncbi:probable calcium-binding protein CML44 [Impatiens glandulifera]|uniref:probable calcium-binding protein CML44 n=1 Tax=Impatiens glandulifera TaxID=253017 RepID=UPI001FB11732|nr:probable calcium-binding protein CML44 [Impatiens glandulifera]
MSNQISINIDLHAIFESLDRNGDGRVSIDEFLHTMEGIGLCPSRDGLESLMSKMSLDFVDFVFFYESLVKEDLVENNQIREMCDLAQAFKVFDANGDGFITSEELGLVLSKLGMWNEHFGGDCNSMINMYDLNVDGMLDFEEFKNMMSLSNAK